MSKKVSFIGAGNMAGAIIGSMLKNGYTPQSISVFDIDKNKCTAINKALAVKADAKSVVNDSDIIFLAVKPQNYKEVLSELKNTDLTSKTFVSIAAGISCDFIKAQLDAGCEVIRVMPNTPLLLGKGATAIAENKSVNPEVFSEVKNIFAMASSVEIINEEKMNEVIAVNGSSPAYVYLFAKAVVDYASSVGIDKDKALTLICETLVGSAEMLLHSGYTPDELIKMVSSPGGTTIAALDKLKDYKFYEGLIEAMKNCTKRAEELSC